MLRMLDTDTASYLIKGKSPAIEARLAGVLGAVRNFVCEAFLKIPRGAARVDLAIGLHACGGGGHLTRVLG